VIDPDCSVVISPPVKNVEQKHGATANVSENGIIVIDKMLFSAVYGLVRDLP